MNLKDFFGIPPAKESVSLIPHFFYLSRIEGFEKIIFLSLYNHIVI